MTHTASGVWPRPAQSAASFCMRVGVIIFLVTASGAVVAQDSLAGRKVVVIRDSVDLKSRARVVGSAYQGDVLSVDTVKETWLWIGDRKGYVKRADVVPLEQAIGYFTAAIRRSPSADGYIARGKVWSALGDSDRAIADHTEAIRRDPRNEIAYMHRAEVWREKREFARAISDYDQMIRLVPNGSSGYSLRASAYRDAGNLDRALADLNEAIRIDGRWWDYAKRGSIRSARQDWDGAISDFSQALFHDPTDWYTFSERGRARHLKGDLAGAVHDYTACLRLNPKYEFARKQRAAALERQGKFSEAISDLLELAPLQSGAAAAETYNTLGWLYATCPLPEVRDGEKAVQYATRACELTEFRLANQVDTLAAAHAERGEFARAVEVQQQAVSLVEEAQRQDFTSRLELYRSQRPYRDPIVLEAIVTRLNGEADSARNRKDYPRSRRVYERVLEIDPGNFHALLHHAETLMAEQEWKSAIYGYDRAAEADPSRFEPYLRRGEAWAELADFPRAISAYTRAIKREPRSEAAYAARAAAFLAKEEPRPAIADYTLAIHLATEDRSRAAYHAGRSQAWRLSGEDSAAVADLITAAHLARQVADYWIGAAEILAGSSDDHARSGEKALRYAARACELCRYKDARALRALAAAHAECGNFTVAASIQSKAVELAGDDAGSDYAAALDSYRDGQPYRLVASP